MVAQTYLCRVNKDLHQVRSNFNRYYCCYLTRNVNPKMLGKGVKVDVIWRNNHQGAKTPYINKVY